MLDDLNTLSGRKSSGKSESVLNIVLLPVLKSSIAFQFHIAGQLAL